MKEKNKKNFKKGLIFVLLLVLTTFFFSCSITFETSKKASAATEITYFKEFNIINNAKTSYGTFNLYNKNGPITIENADYIRYQDSDISYDNNIILLNENSYISGLDTLSGPAILGFNVEYVQNGLLNRTFNIFNYISECSEFNDFNIFDFFNYIDIRTTDIQQSFYNLRFLSVYTENNDLQDTFSPVPYFKDYQYATGRANFAYFMPGTIIIQNTDASYFYNSRNVVYIPTQTVYTISAQNSLPLSSYANNGPQPGIFGFYNYTETTESAYINIETESGVYYEPQRNTQEEFYIDVNQIENLRIESHYDLITFGLSSAAYSLTYEYLNENISAFVSLVYSEEPEPGPGPGPGPGPEPEPEPGEDVPGQTAFSKVFGIVSMALTAPIWGIGLAVYELGRTIFTGSNFFTSYGESVNAIYDTFVGAGEFITNIYTRFYTSILNIIGDIPDLELIPNVPDTINKVLNYGLIVSIVASITLVLYAIFTRDRR